jgi:asparagine synthase (glutamine-hydrolysing)
MSGIMAIVSLDGRTVPAELARAQLEAIAHRGEWAPALHEAPGIALGHVNMPRTPEAEREYLPASDASGRYWITWDGRLDNRDELAAELGFDPISRREKTDADYVLAAYARWGEECVHHLLGDWAIAIWDSVERRLFCAKDPLGWRQLYYAEGGGLFMAGSEPQQLFAGGLIAREPNVDYVLRLLGDALHEPGATCYAGISELQGGQTLVTEPGAPARIAQYWEPAYEAQQRHKHVSGYVEEFEHLTSVATRARLRSNRPIASFVSGGLDSSYVTAVAAGLHPELQALTLYVPGTTYLDERKYARIVAERSHVPLHEIDVSECWHLSSEWLPDRYFDQPYLPGAGAPLRKVASVAKESGAGVILGGEGGDEWIRGVWYGSPYRYVSSALVAGEWRAAYRIAGECEAGRSVPRRLVAAAMEAIALPVAQRFQTHRLPEGPLSRYPAWVAPRDGWHPQSLLNRPSWWAPEPRMRATLQRYREALGMEAGWRDRHIFAGNGLELRSPFYDLRLVEMLLSSPEWVKRHDGQERALLRAALRRAGIPEVASRRDKGTYVEHNRKGLRDRESGRLADAIARLGELPGIHIDGVRLEVDAWERAGHPPRQTVYRFATTGIWLRQLDAELAPRTTGAPAAKSARREEVMQA